MLKNKNVRKKQITYLSVFIESGSHQLSGLLIDGKDREAVAAGDVLDVEHLDESAANRRVHCLNLSTFR